MQAWLYSLAIFLFILGLKRLGSPLTARSGNALSALGMLCGLMVVLYNTGGENLGFILLALVGGAGIGSVMAKRVAMTAMPEMVALFNGFGGGSSFLLAIATYLLNPSMSLVLLLMTAISCAIGGITCTGSVIAWGKLAGVFPSKAVVFKYPRVALGVTIGLLVMACLGVFLNLYTGYSAWLFGGVVLALGVLSL